MNTQDILNLLDDMYEKGPPYRSDGYNVAIREIKEHILEMEENEDDGLLFGGGDRKGKEISSLPSLDIDTQWIDVNEVYKKLDELQEKESRNFEPMATLVSLGIKQAKSAIYEIATKKFPNN